MIHGETLSLLISVVEHLESEGSGTSSPIPDCLGLPIESDVVMVDRTSEEAEHQQDAHLEPPIPIPTSVDIKNDEPAAYGSSQFWVSSRTSVVPVSVRVRPAEVVGPTVSNSSTTPYATIVICIVKGCLEIAVWFDEALIGNKSLDFLLTARSSITLPRTNVEGGGCVLTSSPIPQNGEYDVSMSLFSREGRRGCWKCLRTLKTSFTVADSTISSVSATTCCSQVSHTLKHIDVCRILQQQSTPNTKARAARTCRHDESDHLGKDKLIKRAWVQKWRGRGMNGPAGKDSQ